MAPMTFKLSLLLLVPFHDAAAWVAPPSGVRATSTQLRMTILRGPNGKKKDFKPGTPLSKAVSQLGIKPTYSCKKGDCATCEVFMDGRLTKPCVAKVPPEPTDKKLKEEGYEIRP